MEHLNRVELRGNIGTVRLSRFEGRMCAHITVCTNHYFTDKLGDKCIEVTWHNVVAWSKPDNEREMEKFRKGMKVHVIGRLRSTRYVDASGNERQMIEVQASQIDILAD